MTVLADRYEVLASLGSGGEARVLKALDRQHDRLVALKVRPVRDETVREDLLLEARILLAVPPHPALPLVREDFFDRDSYVVAMDWVDGTDLATLLRDQGRPGLAPSSVLAYLAQAAEALTHLHTQSPPVIHGDVKPGNLILTKGGRVKLVDFGLSSAPNMPRARTGTPGFRAPELAAGSPPTRATDVYALAATAFALLTGSAPAGVLPAWEGIDPAQAQQLEAAIRMGMATDPARRPATPGELVERLRAGWETGLPSGVVTFILSDIEGSTALWDAAPEAMATALVRHDELIARAVAAHGGSVIQTMGEGDSTVSVFASAPDAVAAAIAANRALRDEQWPPDVEIKVRWGLHTGEVERRGLEYRGTTIIVAARVRSQADGDEVLLSEVTSDLAAGHLPDGYELVDLGPHTLKGLARPERIRALKGPDVSAPLPATECPYRGLLSFEAEDRRFFFGREEVVGDLLRRLAPGRLLAVVGASGSGKSSVLRAGLVAAIEAGEMPGLQSASVMTPGAEPKLEVPRERDRLVVVDQFEELFTLCADEERRTAFIDALLALPCVIAIGVRADLYGRVSEHPALAQAVASNQLLLGAMRSEELERAVTEPARLAGLKLEPGLAELVLRDVSGEPGALPLLSHALRATWERRDGRTLTLDGYRQSGGVASAIATTADAVLDELPTDQRSLARNVFVRMTQLGQGTDDTSRRVTIDELVPEDAQETRVRELVDRLAEARLVTLDEGTAEVAHEALIREWPRLRNWLDEDREGIQIHRQLSDAATIWDRGGRERSDLYRGARLAVAAELAHSGRAELNATERAFLDASLAAAEHERRAERRQNRRLRALLAAAVILLAVAIVAGIVSLDQRNHARHAEATAKSQALTSDAERVGAEALTEQNVDRSLLFAVAGVELQNRPETRSDLFADLQQNDGLIRLIRPSSIEITALRVSPDGRLLAVGDASGAVRFIDLTSWRPRGAVAHLAQPVGERAMSFSPDGRTLMVVAIGGERSELDAIDVARHTVRRVLAWGGHTPGPPIGFEAVAYSPDGRLVAVTEDAGIDDNVVPSTSRLLMLDAATGAVRWQRRYPLRPGQGDPHAVFTPSGLLLTSGQEGDTLLWDPNTGRILRRFPLGGLPAPAPDGHTVALGQNSPIAGDQSAKIALLDLRTGTHRTLLAILPDHWIRSLAFTSDGSELAGAATDEVHVWDVASGKIVESYVAQAGPRSLSAINPTDDVLISGRQDGSLAAFDLAGSQRLGRGFRWGTPSSGCGYAPCMSVNPQSSLMATDQADGTVAVVDLRTLRRVRTLPARDGTTAAAISFTPDGRELITGGVNRSVTFWDVASGRVIRTLRFPAPVWWVAMSPDEKLLAVQTGPPDGSSSDVELVRIATGAVLQHHPSAYGPGGVEFSPDGGELAGLACCWSSAGSELTAWSVPDGRRLFGLGARTDGWSFDFSRRAGLLGVGTGSGRLLLLHSRTGKPAAPPIPVSAGEVSTVSFSPDGRTAAVASADHTAAVWDLRSRTRIGRSFGPYPGTVPAVVIEPDGRLLLNLLANAIEWPLDVKSWQRFACRVAGRNLDPAEWQDLLPTRDYRKVCPK